MSAPILLLDLGNSAIKFVTFNPLNASVSVIQRCDYGALADIAGNISHALICSVQDAEKESELRKIIESHDIKTKFIRTTKTYDGLLNSYQHVANMGTDRWVGMLGARELSQNDYLLIDAGTAITVDAVVDNKHIGGWISAGIETAKQALLGNTKRVFTTLSSEAPLAFGQDTPACVINGGIAMALGLCLSGVELIKSYSDKFEIIISGGDGQKIYQSMPAGWKDKCRLSENIVIEGLVYMAKKEFMQKK